MDHRKMGGPHGKFRLVNVEEDMVEAIKGREFCYATGENTLYTKKDICLGREALYMYLKKLHCMTIKDSHQT